MELIIGTSLFAAFVAGVAALFAPCCVTVLLPSYFGSIFREKKKVFLMTFIFFLGVLTVFLPLGFGIASLGQFFSKYHRTIFSIAGVFFFLLGAMLITGRRMATPWKFHPKLEGHNAGSVYLLGLFSGVATTCCAPVLAGVLALSILPGSVIWGLVYTLAYVLGMVLPLFLLSIFLDKTRFTEKLMSIKKTFEFTLFGRTARITVPELISGIAFILMGAITFFWASMNKTATHSEFQVSVNVYLTRLNDALTRVTGGIPEIVWAVIFFGLFALIVWSAIRKFKKNKVNTQNEKQQ